MNDGRLRDQVFNASAATKVVVSTTGGKGGYGIAKENGDGSNGGNGGNITVLVDPSVTSYNVRHASSRGEGGNPSPIKNSAFGKRDRGRDGSERNFEERRQRVTIP